RRDRPAGEERHQAAARRRGRRPAPAAARPGARAPARRVGPVGDGAAEVALMFRSPWWLAAAIPLLAAAWGLLAWGAARRRRVGAALGREASLSRSAEDAGARRRL